MADRADFAILTVVPEAHTAVEQLFGLTASEQRNGLPFVAGDVTTSTGTHHVVLAMAADRSNLPAQEATERLLRLWRPRYLLVADIGGGFNGRDGLTVGDVVFANYLHYYELVKETVDGVEQRYLPLAPPSLAPRLLLTALGRQTAWLEPLGGAPRAGGGTPRLLEGEIVAGDRLLSDPTSDVVADLASSYRKALAVDMESAGVARAVYSAQAEGIFTQFAILRGISDLVDARHEDNQATREDWKPRAALAAAAAALAFVHATEPVQQADAQLPSVVLEHRTSFQQSLASRLPSKRAFFPLDLRTATRGSVPREDAEELQRALLLSAVEQERCSVLYGPSGAGKSWALLDIARQLAAGDDPLAVLIDLKAFRPEWAAALPEAPIGQQLAPAIDAILSAAIAPISVKQLEQLLRERTVLLLVDAINEVAEVGERMRFALNEYARQQPAVRIIVTDRRPELFYRDSQWKLIACRGLAGPDVRAIVDERFGDATYDALQQPDRELLELPFFLDWALEIGDPQLAPRTRAMERFLHRSGLTDSDIIRLADVAFHTYHRRRSVFDASDVSQLRDDDLLPRLLTTGVVVRRDGGERFAHQLYHQFCAATWVAAGRAPWTPDTLDTITARATSLDAVGMALALIPQVDERDKLLRIVYDWNWRAAVLALHETQVADKDVSPALETAVLAMAAEKRFDPIAGTSGRVTRQLRTFPADGIAASLRAAATHDDVLRQVAELSVDGPAWYADWKQVFLARPAAGPLDDHVIALVSSHEPMLGWTAANTIRRFPHDAVREAQLRVLYLERDDRSDPSADTIRWRVVHALGRWPTADGAALLVRSLDDDNGMWVRYGAVRSLMEMAACTDDGLRSTILRALRERIHTLDREPLSQIGWSALHRNASVGWIDAVRPLIVEIVAAQESDTDRQRWERRLARFDRYATAHA